MLDGSDRLLAVCLLSGCVPPPPTFGTAESDTGSAVATTQTTQAQLNTSDATDDAASAGSDAPLACDDPERERCAGVCVDLGSDPDHCGGCDEPCGAAEMCSEGVCVWACEWGEPALLHAGDGSLAGVGIDAAGNAVAVGSEVDGGWAMGLDAAAETWESLPGPGIPVSAFAAGAGGHIVVAAGGGSASATIVGRRFDPIRRVWGAPLDTMHVAKTLVGNPVVAIDGAGNALIVWDEFDIFFGSVVFARRFDSALGVWGPAAFLGSGDGQTATMEETGDAYVVWPSMTGLWAARFTLQADAWSSPERIDEMQGPFLTAVRLDSAGASTHVLFATEEGVDLIPGLWASTYDVEIADWEMPRQVLATTDRIDRYQLVVDEAGNAVAAWELEDPDGKRRIEVSRFDVTLAMWSTVDALEVPETVVPLAPVLVGDEEGNALVVWRAGSILDAAIGFHRFSAASKAWAVGEVIAEGSNIIETRAALSADGSAVVAWRVGDIADPPGVSAVRCTPTASSDGAP